MKDERPFTFAPALEKTGKIPNLGSAPLAQAGLLEPPMIVSLTVLGIRTSACVAGRFLDAIGAWLP